MPQVSNNGVAISYDVSGQGRPLLLLHGWCCDRSWWTEPGYVEALRSDHRLVNVDIRGHGASDKPHQAAAYRADALIGDVIAVVDAEGLEAIIASGAWDPRPSLEEPTGIDEWDKALRDGGTRALVDLFRSEDGEAFDREFPPWARAVTLRADPAALLAAHAPELWTEGIPDTDLRSFPAPALLIAGEHDDPDDDAANVAAMIPNGQRLRLPGLGHGGSCAASALVIPTARAFLDRWFAW
jgi:pimeloyl-ACP methyl ester carboxylesterase